MNGCEKRFKDIQLKSQLSHREYSGKKCNRGRPCPEKSRPVVLNGGDFDAQGTFGNLRRWFWFLQPGVGATGPSWAEPGTLLNLLPSTGRPEPATVPRLAPALPAGGCCGPRASALLSLFLLPPWVLASTPCQRGAAGTPQLAGLPVCGQAGDTALKAGRVSSQRPHGQGPSRDAAARGWGSAGSGDSWVLARAASAMTRSLNLMLGFLRAACGHGSLPCLPPRVVARAGGDEGCDKVWEGTKANSPGSGLPRARGRSVGAGVRALAGGSGGRAAVPPSPFQGPARPQLWPGAAVPGPECARLGPGRGSRGSV